MERVEERNQQRAEVIAATVEALREAEARHGMTDDFLTEAKALVAELARRRDLFTWDDYPLEEDRRVKLHELSMGDDDRLGVYLICTNGWMRNKPHDHGSWVIQGSIEGTEHHRIYERRDDGSDPFRADLAQVDEFDLHQGEAAGLLPGGIHATQTPGEDATMHIHVYGTALHVQTDRNSFNPKNGRIEPMPQMNRRPGQG